ncbi:MAG: cytochrome c maturation protein CcmE [Deltaproteobacteria bacterium]|jgi:cytochrome c-type biogenesis protein CcmE|nr:cytochrome c maturation protein CcmE [Deltaproteobacteria bacterium]
MQHIVRKNNSKKLYIAAFILLLSGIGYLVATGLATGTVLHAQVAEALSLPQGKARAMSITGSVSPDRISVLEDSRGVRFQIQDHKFPDKVLWAVYQGDIPDLFAPGAPIIIEGLLRPGQDFKVLKLITLCPTKYEEKAGTSRQS